MIVLVLDAQKLITNSDLFGFDRWVSHIRLIIEQAREHGVELVYVRHDDGPECELTRGKEGFEIYEEFEPAKGERIFDKTVNSAFRDSGLLAYITEKAEKDIMIVGIQTEYCMDATIKCGFEHGLHMIVPAYTNSTVDNQYLSGEQSYYYYNDFIWNQRYAECITIEEAVRRIVTC